MEAGRIVWRNTITKLKVTGKPGTKHNLLLTYFKQEIKESLYLRKSKSCLKQRVRFKVLFNLIYKRKKSQVFKGILSGF